MESTKETTALEMRIAWAKEHWGPFFSEMVLRETNLTLATQPCPDQVETPSEIISKLDFELTPSRPPASGFP
jgi:hypothetical protein